MKICFSTLACPSWTFPTVAARAKELGYAGVELRGFLNETDLTTCNPFLTDPRKLKSLFRQNNVDIACLSSGISMDADETRRYIDFAQQLECRFIRIFDLPLQQGGIVELCDFLSPLAEYAIDRHVTILVENAISLRRASDLWKVMDRLDHPAIGVSLNARICRQMGETFDTVIPTLAKWLKLVRVQQIDESSRELIHRLKGVGYAGWICVEVEKLYVPDLPEPENSLRDAIGELQKLIAQ